MTACSATRPPRRSGGSCPLHPSWPSPQSAATFIASGLRIHRVAWLDIRDAAIAAGIPVTSAARTLIDLAAPDRECALTEARVLKLVTYQELRATIDRYPLRSGTRHLRALPLHGYIVDAVWPAQRLVVEVDGFACHGHRAAFESDRRRDQTLAAGGYTVIRITWRQLTTEPTAVVARLAQALAAAGPRSGQRLTNG